MPEPSAWRLCRTGKFYFHFIPIKHNIFYKLYWQPDQTRPLSTPCTIGPDQLDLGSNSWTCLAYLVLFLLPMICMIYISIYMIYTSCMTCSKCHVEEHKARRQNCESKLFSVVYRVILIKENCVVHSRVSLTVIFLS